MGLVYTGGLVVTGHTETAYERHFSGSCNILGFGKAGK